MKIERLPHGSKLFGLIGEFCVSREVHQELGAPITSDATYIWFVALENGRVAGFAAVRPLKNAGRGKLVHLYVPPGHADIGVERRLLESAEAEARSQGISHLTTVDYGRRQRFYEFNGWKAEGQRGRFITYVRELPDA